MFQVASRSRGMAQPVPWARPVRKGGAFRHIPTALDAGDHAYVLGTERIALRASAFNIQQHQGVAAVCNNPRLPYSCHRACLSQ